MNAWQIRLEDTLRAVDAPPVLTRDLLSRFAKSAHNNQAIPTSTLTWWLRNAVKSGRLQSVQRGLYLNRLRAVPGQLADAIPWLHKDAIVSLNTVLGDDGVLNNPTNTVMAIVPLDRGASPPHLGRKKTSAGTFHFFGMPRHILEAGKPADRLQALDRYEHPRATPEKALIDWLYLADSPRSRRTLPPHNDIDMTLLKLARLRRLATAAGLSDKLEQWQRVHGELRVLTS
ncbi:MAG: hypothetical protein ACI9SC_000247 [Gammaproteobacteria bacterium]|jgi:hypothetical protein